MSNNPVYEACRGVWLSPCQPGRPEGDSAGTFRGHHQAGLRPGPGQPRGPGEAAVLSAVDIGGSDGSWAQGGRGPMANSENTARRVDRKPPVGKPPTPAPHAWRAWCSGCSTSPTAGASPPLKTNCASASGRYCRGYLAACRKELTDRRGRPVIEVLRRGEAQAPAVCRPGATDRGHRVRGAVPVLCPLRLPVPRRDGSSKRASRICGNASRKPCPRRSGSGSGTLRASFTSSPTP